MANLGRKSQPEASVAGEAQEMPPVMDEFMNVHAGDQRCRALLGSDVTLRDGVIRLPSKGLYRLTPGQAKRCYRLLRAAGDVWAWLLDSNRDRRQQGDRAVVGYQSLCRQLTSRGGFGELSVVGARSVLQRYSDAWFEAARRHNRGERAGVPRRKRFLVPIQFYNGTVLLIEVRPSGDRNTAHPPEATRGDP